MKLKSTIAAVVATSALVGAVLLPEMAQAKPCIFSQQGGITDSAPSSNPTADPTTTQADLNDLNKLGIVGASFAVLGGLLAGGVFLKRRFDRKSEPLEADMQPEVLPTQLANPLAVPTEFAIEIPPEVIQSIRATEESNSELTSAR
ncbi:hypothetical protein HJG54_33370 [Leptolyngbya sp. NK1-12]|uniref:LPXTG cell wall anchor domain-containing protein n=1 Tax=Leptolyngbya sp. NK1-12 TaxID=2547451 RepID=A0AA96WLJ5_9CYAN|nr:hypothetical protein [Leptolyngbya sp. NK1-12]WNZ27733.1 hypothetical protein HJG54_33370 [Leptolyngbya sp. NK1-12]